MRSGNQLIFKISYLTIGSLFCLTLYFTYSSYALHLKFKTEDKLNHLAAIVNTAATFVDGDAYEQLLQNQKANPEKIENNLLYKKLHHQLQDIYERSQLESPIYFLTYDESAQQFIYGPTSSSVSYFGKSYTQFPEILMERYTEGAVINRYDTENGQWLSAFSPIRNSKGEVVAVLQADSPFCSFWSKALQDLFFNTLLSLMVVLLLAFTLRKYMKRMIQLSSEKELAEEKAEIKSKFLSTMSHEIRTPMNAVIGLTNILLDESPREDQKKNLKTLKFSADLLLTLINDILDYSKLEAGEINLEEINYDLHQLIYNIMDSFRLTAEKKQLPLEIYIDEKVPTHVIGDPVRLSQILTNLVGNAIKFTEQGKVAVHLTMMDQKGERANIRFEVIDTGIGIPEDKFEAIFESFTQADLTTTRKFGGTGLGLSIIKRLLNLQGSRIMLKSVLGKGSTFYFDLHMKIGEATINEADRMNTQNKPSIPQKISFSGSRILLVEDNKINVMVAMKFLKKWGLEVDIAENGQIAIDMVHQEDYELILMDLDMPVMDGYEATWAIRQSEVTSIKNIPIVALSASAVSDFRTRAMEVGMNEYVTKPFKPEELYVVLGKFLRVKEEVWD